MFILNETEQDVLWTLLGEGPEALTEQDQETLNALHKRLEDEQEDDA
jgi:hypothetical protein